MPSTSANQDVIQCREVNTEDSAIKATSPKNKILLNELILFLFND